MEREPVENKPADSEPVDGGPPEADPAETAQPAPGVHLPRPSEPAVVSAVPIADANVDLGVAPLTRRQARQQERIRTASVPVITPDRWPRTRRRRPKRSSRSAPMRRPRRTPSSVSEPVQVFELVQVVRAGRGCRRRRFRR